MKKLSIKDIIDFRRKSERSRITFVNNLKLDKEKTNSESGGDYWITSLSAISSSYKSGNKQLINEKIEELKEKLDKTNYKITKTMYRRNIDILLNYNDFDFKRWKPSKFDIKKKQKEDSILNIKGVEIKVNPHHVFTFGKNDNAEIGAIWFIAKLGGFEEDELGMFTEILYKYLKHNFSINYIISPKYCLAVDVVNGFDVSYSQIQKTEVPKLLTSTINDIIKLI